MRPNQQHPNRLHSRLTPEQCLRHLWLKKLVASSEKQLNKENLKKYLTKRRWNKVMNTVSALKRMGGEFGSRIKSQPSTFLDQNTLNKTKSSPSINVILSKLPIEDNCQSVSSINHSDHSASIPSFKRSQSTVESPKLNGHSLAKSNIMSMSSNHLDTLHEEFEGYYESAQKKLPPITEKHVELDHLFHRSKTKIDDMDSNNNRSSRENYADLKQNKVNNKESINCQEIGKSNIGYSMQKFTKNKPVSKKILEKRSPVREIEKVGRTKIMNGECKIEVQTKDNYIQIETRISALAKSQSSVTINEIKRKGKYATDAKIPVLKMGSVEHLEQASKNIKFVPVHDIPDELLGSRSKTNNYLIPLKPTVRNAKPVRDRVSWTESSGKSGLVDQLLNQMKPSTRRPFGFLKFATIPKPEKMSETRQAFSENRIVKPYISTNKDGLPRSSGSVMTMAKRFTNSS